METEIKTFDAVEMSRRLRENHGQQLAAAALANRLTLATRNTAELKAASVPRVDPWSETQR